jgi:hypothetical protein
MHPAYTSYLKVLNKQNLTQTEKTNFKNNYNN